MPAITFDFLGTSPLCTAGLICLYADTCAAV
jgi:hypothetical protein